MAFPLLLHQLSLQLFHANTLVAKRSSKIFGYKESSIKSCDPITCGFKVLAYHLVLHFRSMVIWNDIE